MRFKNPNSRELDAFIERIKPNRIKQSDGGYSFRGLIVADAATVIATHLRVASKVSFSETERLVKTALFQPGLSDDFDVTELCEFCEKLYKHDHSQRRHKYVVHSGIVSYSGIKFDSQELNGVEIKFHEPDSFSKTHVDLVEQRQFKFDDTYKDCLIIPYTASVDAVDAVSAFEAVREAVDYYRGLINLSVNIQKMSRSSWGRGLKPLNDFLNARYSTIHNPDGSEAHSGIFFQRDWVSPSKSQLSQDERDTFIWRIREYQNRGLRAHPLRGFAEKCVQRYVRALDGSNWRYAFLELWSVLELACCVQEDQSHQVIVKRVSKLYADGDETKLYLDHLRLRRNNMVHKGYEVPEDISEQMLYQLNRYVSQVLFTLVSNFLDLQTLSDWIYFLELPRDRKQLQKQRMLINQALKFRG